MATLPLDDPKTYEMIGARRLGRRVPVRVRGHARGAQEGPADRVRRPRRARRALPPGRDGPDPRRTRAASATRSRSRSPTSACAPIIGPTNGRDPLPGAGDADRQVARRASAAPKADDLRKAIGKKNREAMAKLEPEFREGCRGVRRRPARRSTDAGRRTRSPPTTRFNKSHAACYALIAYRTAWLKANYPAEYMAALISSVMDTKDKVPFFVARCEDMGIEILPPDVNLSDHEFVVVDGQHPLRPRRRQGRRLRGRRGDQGRARGGRPVHVALGLLRARRRARGQQEGDRGADQVRRVRLDRRDAQGHARRCSSRRRRAGPEVPARRPDRPGLDLRPGGPRRRRRAARRGRSAPAHPPIPIEEFDQRELLAVEKESIGLFISDAPAQGGARGAAARRSTARSPSCRSARTASGSPSAA